MEKLTKRTAGDAMVGGGRGRSYGQGRGKNYDGNGGSYGNGGARSQYGNKSGYNKNNNDNNGKGTSGHTGCSKIKHISIENGVISSASHRASI